MCFINVLNKSLLNGYSSRKGTMCILVHNMLQRISEDEKFLKRICFSDEATFHVSGKLKKHNIRIWGLEHPHEIRELERDSPKVNVWCKIMCNRVIGPFFFHETTITADVYLDLLTEYVVAQLIDSQPTIIF